MGGVETSRVSPTDEQPTPEPLWTVADVLRFTRMRKNLALRAHRPERAAALPARWRSAVQPPGNPCLAGADPRGGTRPRHETEQPAELESCGERGAGPWQPSCERRRASNPAPTGSDTSMRSRAGASSVTPDRRRRALAREQAVLWEREAADAAERTRKGLLPPPRPDGGGTLGELMEWWLEEMSRRPALAQAERQRRPKAHPRRGDSRAAARRGDASRPRAVPSREGARRLGPWAPALPPDGEAHPTPTLGRVRGSGAGRALAHEPRRAPQEVARRRQEEQPEAGEGVPPGPRRCRRSRPDSSPPPAALRRLGPHGATQRGEGRASGNRTSTSCTRRWSSAARGRKTAPRVATKSSCRFRTRQSPGSGKPSTPPPRPSSSPTSAWPVAGLSPRAAPATGR